MRTLQLVLLVAVVFPPLCSAQESCPWLNTATAGGVLGGAVIATITHSGKNKADTTCDFVLRKESVEDKLRIEVETMTDPKAQFASFAAQCGPTRTPLRAIGNEAVVCTPSAKKGRVSEQVVGRVRDQAFIVRISTNDHGAAQSSLREKARAVAEQVAGILF